MTYIVVALKAEAQAFVDAYKLKKSKLGNYTLYSNKTMRLIISGMGVTNARLATQTLINNYDITDEDSYYNIGICGASKAYVMGEVLEIGSIVYKGLRNTFNDEKKEIVCVDDPVSSSSEYEIVDMESFGFYDAVVHNPAIKNFFIIKVVSDHFEPKSVTKEGAKKIIFNFLQEDTLFA